MAATLKLQKPPYRQKGSPPPPRAARIVEDPTVSAIAADDLLSVDSTGGIESPAAEPAADHAAESRHEHIALAAYFLAEARGFEQGHELDDWLSAERQIDVP